MNDNLDPKEKKNTKDKVNKFYLEKTYPEVNQLIEYSYPNIEEVADNSIYVFDTNALLTPYLAGKTSLDEIQKELLVLKTQGRIFFPARVVREFANNRAKKLVEIYSLVSQKIQTINSRINNFSIDDLPILDHLEEFKELRDSFKDIRSLSQKSVSYLHKIEDYISNIFINDPVSVMYKDIIVAETIVEMQEKQENLEKDLEFRIIHGIPPGFKDSSKLDSGIGDLIIWQTIKELAQQHNKNIIFVSDEKKPDWFYTHNKKAIFPRFELIDELRRINQNISFFMIDFSRFLEIRKVNKEVVDEIDYGRILRKRRRYYELQEMIQILSIEDFELQHNIGDKGQDLGLYIQDGTDLGTIKRLQRELDELFIRSKGVTGTLNDLNKEYFSIKEELDNNGIEY